MSNINEQQRSSKIQSKSMTQILQNIERKRQNSQNIAQDIQVDNDSAYIQQDNQKTSQKNMNNKARSLESRSGEFSPYKQSDYLQKKRFSGDKQESGSSKLSRSSEKYKTLVDSNNRKNYQIWIKSDSIVRVPKSIRQSQEKLVQIQDQTSINYEEIHEGSPEEHHKQYSNSQQDYVIKLSVRETALAQNKQGFPRDKSHIAQQIQQNQFETCDMNTSQQINLVSLNSQQDEYVKFGYKQSNHYQVEEKQQKLNDSFQINYQLQKNLNKLNDYTENQQNKNVEKKEKIFIQLQNLNQSNSEVIIKDIGNTQIFIDSAKFSENKFNNQNLRDSRFEIYSQEINQKFGFQIPNLQQTPQVKTKQKSERKKEEGIASEKSQLTDQTEKAFQKGNFQNLEKNESFQVIQQNDSLKINQLKRKSQVINSKNLSIDQNAKIIEVKENKNTLNFEKQKKQLSPIKSHLMKITKQIGDEKSSSATISVHQQYMDIEIFKKPILQNNIKRPSSGQQQYDSDKEKEFNEIKKSQLEILSQQINGTASQETILNLQAQKQVIKKTDSKPKNNDLQIIEKKSEFKQLQILIQKPPQINLQKTQKNNIPLGNSLKIKEQKHINDNQKSMHVRSDINLNKQKNLQNLLKYEQNSQAGTEKTAGHQSSHKSFQKVQSIQLVQVKNHEEEIKLLINSFQQNQIKNEINSKKSELKQIKQILPDKLNDKQILKPVQQTEQRKNISKYAQTSEKFKNDQAIQKNTDSERQSKLNSESQQKKHERSKKLSQQLQILNQSQRKFDIEIQNSDSLKNQFNPITQTIQSDDPLKNNDLLSVPESNSLQNHPYFKSEADGEDFTNKNSMIFKAHISELNRDYQSLQEKDGQKLSKFVSIIDKDFQVQNQQEIVEPIDMIFQKTIEQNKSLYLIQEQDQKIESNKKEIISTNHSAIFGANPEFNQMQMFLNNENDLNKTISSKQDDKSGVIKTHDHISQTARIQIQNYEQNSQGEHSAFKSQQTMNYIMPHNQDSIFRNNYNQDSIQQSSAMVSSTINLIQEHNVNFQNINGQYIEDAVITGDSYFIWQGQDQKQQSIDIDVNDPYKLKKRFHNIQHKKQLELTKVPIINIQANVFEKTKIKDTSPKSQQKQKNNEILVLQNDRKSYQENHSYQKSDQINNEQLSQVNILTTGSPKINSQISTQNRFKSNHNEKTILAASYNMRDIINDKKVSKQTKKFENIIDSEQSNMSINNQNILNNENYFPVKTSNDQNSFFNNKDQKRFQMQSLNQYYNGNKNRIKANVFSESGGDNFKLSYKNRYSRKILSVEPLPNQIGFGSNDFFQDRKVFKQDETDFSNNNTLRNNEQLKLEPQFNLKNFIRKNNLQKVLINDFNQKNSIYDFHKNNQFQGGYKNQGPMENQIDSNSQKYSQNSQLYNFRQQVKQMAQMKNIQDKNYQHQINKKDNLSSSRKRQFRNNSSEHEDAFENGLINIEQAFMLIQYIKRSQGTPTMSELEIVDYIANQNSLNTENNYMKNNDIQSQIKKFKWKEVMRFMKVNPHIMMQLLSLNEIISQGLPQKEEDFNIINVQVQKNQKEIQARQRYTDIVLNNMRSRIPPVFIQQQRQNLQQIANSNINDPKVFQRRNLKILSRHNQHDLESKANFPSNKTKFNLKESKFRSKDSKNNQSIEKNQNSSRKQTIKISNQRISSNDNKLAPIQDQKYSRKQMLPSLPTDYTKNQEKLPKKQNLKIQSLDIQKEINTRNELSILNQMFNQHNEKENRNIHHQKINSQMNIVFKTQQQQEDDHQNERFANINYEKYLNPQSQMNVGSFQKMLNQNGVIRDSFMQKIDMKQYMSSIEMKKPKTNQVKKRQKKINNNQEQLQDMNSFSINMKMKGENIEPENNMDSMEHTPRNINNKSQPNMNKKNSEELYKKLKSNPQSKQFIIHENLTVEDQMQIEINKNLSMFDSKTNQNMYQDRKSEFSNQRTSYIFSRNEELNKQKQMLENEESELIQQRKQIQGEKDKITRMLQRLDKKQELVEKEDQVKKQRMILEIEKKQLRDDIQELDNLKNMLEQKKKDNLVGFSDLAESNKEMRSLKSGDLHKDRQFMLSKQSLRSRKFEFNKDTKIHSGSQVNHRLMSEENKSQVYGNPNDKLQKLSVTSNHFKAQQEIMSITDQSPININKINISANNQIKQAGSEYDANHQKRCKTVENDVNEVNDYQDANNTKVNIFTKQIMINEYDCVLMKSVENKPFMKKTFTQVDENSNNNMQGSVNSKWLGPQNVLSSPMSQSNMTFITGQGVFDWSNSLLMEDILQNQIKFKRSYISIDKEQDSEDIVIFSEDEIYQQIDQIKISHKNLRNPQILDVVFDKAYYTLETLMCYMNQSILFEIISEKYQDITIDNCVKLLVRCKQVLESREIAYETLKQIVQFEQDVYQVRVEIDSLLENSQNKELLMRLQEKSCEMLPSRTKKIIGGISKLRDQYKLFNKIAATTSKGNQVLNIMAYKKRDAYRYIMREYEAIKRLVQVVDIQMPTLQLN